jgi:hypothetical protein
VKKNFYLKFLFIGIALNLLVSMQLISQINFPLHSQYRYLKGSQAASLASNWMGIGFNDGLWAVGNAPFWYGDNTGSGTQLADMQNSYSTVYLRSSFEAFNVANISEVSFYISYDDGFVIWINGVEALSRLAPATYSYNSFSTGLHEYDAPETIVLSADDLNLQEGDNKIAIQVFNTSLESSDIYLDLSINAASGIPVLNDTIGVIFNKASGFYSSDFSLSMSSPDPAATLIYTLDGSNPQTSTTGYTAGTSTSITINPSSTSGRGTTPAVVIRACITKAGFLPSYPTTRTYIYLDKVKMQSYPGYNWPSTYVNDQWIDLEMDPDVVNDPRYTSLIDDALLDIPTISVATDNNNLFDPATGIYVNALEHGSDWERECSVELINPDGTEDFNVNAGLRIRGGWSRNDYFPKHGLRLFFRSEYGDPKLHYALFGDDGVDQFDKIDLRCEQNYAWSTSGGNGRHTLLREIFSRDTQRDMNQPYTRSRYYHLYLNGMYWGIYQTQERSEARYASDYFGGKSEDYDVIKVNSDGYQVEATDGNISSWQRIYSMCSNGFENNEDYFSLEGKNAQGKPMPNAEVMVDIDNLIDYMLTIFYSGNFDAPTSSFMSNKGPNNFYAIDNRNDKSKGFVFFNHDGEHAMFVDQAWPGVGLSENRVNIGDIAGDYQMTVSSLYGFHPQWLHYKLSSNPEYRMRFADRAALYLANNGVLTNDKSWSRMRTRKDQIDMAIIAESVRWGDAQNGTPYTKDDNWLPQVDQLENSFFPARTNIVINQLRNEGLYPSLNNPEFKRSGSVIYDQSIKISSSVAIVVNNPNSDGIIYYTLNDTDPRQIGGEVSSSAIEGGDETTLNLNASAIIKARVYEGGEWSPMRQIKIFAASDDLTQLKITEIHYHPQDIIVGVDTTDGGDLEFMEFKNIGGTSLNLSGIVVDSAIYFKFPPSTILGPGQFYVIASKPQTFYERYGMIASGNFSGNLSNSGEEILINDASGSPFIHFTYDDHNPWPEDPDGNGPSMVSASFNPTGDPGTPGYWRTSLRIGGSPFEDDTPTAIDEPFSNEEINPDIVVYPNPTADVIQIRFENDITNDPLKIRLYNIEGELIYETKAYSDSMIELNRLGFKAGIYFIELELANRLETKKVIYTPY